MSLRDGALGVSVGGVFGVVMDLLVTGGDAVFFLLAVAADQSGLVFLLLSRLLAAAPQVAWLPTGKIQTAFTVVSLLLSVVVLYQLVRSTRRSINSRT